ncbi:MAG: response regulator [Chitinophagaceae bacterium]|nr:MAG: response regulator [Chitinophagaceae bacterium]
MEALRYLGAVKEVGERPCLIVLDLNMPYLNGRDTFERIRNDAGLRGIPVIIFTSSLNPHDKAYFTGLGADFVTKPDDYKELNGIARRMIHACTCDERP